MTPNNYTERNFEEHIEVQLLNSGYIKVDNKLYDKSLCLIPSQLIAFIQETQPKKFKKLTEQYGEDTNTKLTKRISEKIESKGVIEVLRKGVKDRGSHFDLVYFHNFYYYISKHCYFVAITNRDVFCQILKDLLKLLNLMNYFHLKLDYKHQYLK